MIVEENTAMPAEGDIYVADFDIDKLDGAENLQSNTNPTTHKQDHQDCFGFEKLIEESSSVDSETDISTQADSLNVDSLETVDNEYAKAGELNSNREEKNVEIDDHVSSSLVDINARSEVYSKQIIIVNSSDKKYEADSRGPVKSFNTGAFWYEIAKEEVPESCGKAFPISMGIFHSLPGVFKINSSINFIISLFFKT